MRPNPHARRQRRSPRRRHAVVAVAVACAAVAVLAEPVLAAGQWRPATGKERHSMVKVAKSYGARHITRVRVSRKLSDLGVVCARKVVKHPHGSDWPFVGLRRVSGRWTDSPELYQTSGNVQMLGAVCMGILRLRATAARATHRCGRFMHRAGAVMITHLRAAGVSCSYARVVANADTVAATIKHLGQDRYRYRNTERWTCTTRTTEVQLEGAPPGQTIDGPSRTRCRKSGDIVKFTSR